MRTLIKWPGGKAREYKNIKGIIPTDIKTYIEPFFGGGGIYFNLEPKKSIINDINENLMTLYRFIKKEDKRFREALNQIADDWDNLSIIAKTVFDDTKQYKNNISESRIANEISRLSRDNNLPKLINGQEKYWELLAEGLVDKLHRIIWKHLSFLSVTISAFSLRGCMSRIRKSPKSLKHQYFQRSASSIYLY